MKAAILPFACFALMGCTTAPPPGPPAMLSLPQPQSSATVTVPLGGKAMLNGMTLVPQRIVEDSRCPVDVQCVWAGRLVVETVILLRGGSEELRLNLETGKAFAVAGGQLTLLDAQPAKLAGEPVPPSAYRFTLRFERG